ncbi:hypothetical protein RBH26_05590 [Natronolimnohabitans sp. A-GB9]|uniref:DUF7853 family protein n=1 Tax=Natronolimnohabitans sp. A-GB9 TaxID=3069757 RepID=UPI0027B41D8A|nr:hypothetical protein [Natronolimnohabitans sp. A-GB9]MDQ2049951.1 hypothetical protein [Natronolimnohabitans sp. A-GB9]
MSSQPPETETHEVTLSRDEQWVAHATLVDYIDGAIDDDETPPSWAIDLLEEIEAGNGTDVFTGRQMQRLTDAMSDYLDREDVPERDCVHGSNVVERLEDRLEE